MSGADSKMEDNSQERKHTEEEKPPLQQDVEKRRGFLLSVDSFKYAVNGILDVFRTQKHMRFHFGTVVIVLLGALLLKYGKQDIVILLFTIALVLMAEMFNTAIETVVDMITPTYHPLAKAAKDAAAGAVLIATTTAILIGFLILVSSLGGFGYEPPDLQTDWIRLVITGLVLLVFVIIIKALSSKGKLLKGGLISGHTVAGFFIASAILYITRNAIPTILAVMMALLIAQSRVEARIHTVQEVIIGALTAILVSAFSYYLFPLLQMAF